MTKAEKQKALDAISEEIRHCKICQKDKIGVAVPGEGSADADVVFIGEAPGKQEAETGRPFIGRSGKLLRKLIAEVGLKDDDVYITSPVKYLPVHVTPTPAEIAHGRTHLMKQFAVIQPRFVVLLGRVAAEGVLERKVAVAKEHGSIIEERDGIRYFLTYHPAAALRFRKNLEPLEADFAKLKTLLLDLSSK
jgi:uracil-DNA glycosylase family 4